MLLHIAIAIDESEQRARLTKLLVRRDTIVETLQQPEVFWKDIAGRAFDVLIVNRDLIGEQALSQVRILRESGETPAIIILSDREDDEDRMALIAAGCETVVNPQLSLTKIKATLNTILNRRRSAAVTSLYLPRTPPHAEITDFVAISPVMQRFVKNLPKIARSGSSVLILGETGVGKERLAHALHAGSRRPNGPFIAIHCGALPESLLESELFGHEQGAFTGATKVRRGCFELAHLGTVFLDEIGEMPLHLQSKLLRILEDSQLRRVGSEKAVTVDVRVMAATNRDLEEEVKAKQFRRDLFYRLNVVSLTVPPLRERIEDVPVLAESYIHYLSHRIGCVVSGISEEAIKALCRYAWPGNVRELINVIERAMLLCEKDMITCDHLPKSITEPAAASEEAGFSHAGRWPDELMDKPLKEARKCIFQNFEKEYLVRLLKSTNGRIGEIAQRAGIDSRSVFDKMKAYDLKKEDFR